VSDILPASEIQRLTGYKRQADQLRELHRQGFYRARRARVTGEVILERPHYDEVARGRASSMAAVRQPKLRLAT
jgi:hypothetical protein